ncbi:MAG: hypothetical protein AAGJ40_00070 [Planctomycetota bacterium]
MTTKRTYRGSLPKPDRRGYVRPEVGDQRFTVGNVRDVSQGEMTRRLTAVKDLFEQQCARHEIDVWISTLVPYAKKLARGERLVFTVSSFARSNDGQASEEAQALDQLRDLGLRIEPDDPNVIAKGEAEFQRVIADKIRAEVERAFANVDDHFERFPKSLVERTKNVRRNPDELEVRTFHQAIDAYRQHLAKAGKRQDSGALAPSVKNYRQIAKRLRQETDDFQLFEADRNKLDELFGHWRNRPVSKQTGKRISPDHSKHTMDCLWAIFTWIDEASDWRWDLPKGAKRINRSPIDLDSDRTARRTRRISSNTYNPDQLAVIANELDMLGKLILGVCVNCGMQPAEVGRLEHEDFYLSHPETGAEGCWIVFDRPKTHEYGEWLLWPEVAELVTWGCDRAKRLGTQRLIITETGKPWYRDDWNNPATQFAKWWQAKPSKSASTKGVVTKLSEKDNDFPRYTIKWLRKILPNLARPKYGKEIADLLNARKVDRSGRVAGRDTDRYADRLYDQASKALMELESHFRPFLDALKPGPEED